MTRRSDERVVIDVRWENGWVVRAGKGPVEAWATKPPALKSAVYLAFLLTDAGRMSQVRVFGKDGRIQREMTYGADPPAKG